MSDKCGNCDCADSTQCTKNGNQYGFEAEMKNNFDDMVMYGAENDCKCNCGSGSCACSTNCGCGCH